MNMSCTVTSVQPLQDMVLLVGFSNGSRKTYDVKPLINEWEVFKDLLVDGLYDRVRVDESGKGILWNDYLDLYCDELWKKGTEVAS